MELGRLLWSGPQSQLAGHVVAASVEAAAAEFKTDIRKLIAVRRLASEGNVT
jgi:uncharacterized protein YciI